MRRTAVGAVVVLLTVSGCGGGGGGATGNACVPGMSVACACANGTQGSMVCASNGDYGSCMCSGGLGAAGTTGGAGTSGTGGTTGAAGSVGTGGTTGAAGDVGTGGTTGAAGDVGTGGTTGAGGSVGTGGTTGAGGAGGGSTPACRTYATSYTVIGSNGSNTTMTTYTCSHSETSGFDRTCMNSFGSFVYHWPSRSDFVDEAAAVGITRLASVTYDTGLVYTYEYDAQKRLQRILQSGAPYVTCDAWDTLDRCTHEVVATTCSDAQATISYGQRTVTYDLIGAPCDEHSITTYDDDLIVTGTDQGNGVTATYTTTSRATVCR